MRAKRKCLDTLSGEYLGAIPPFYAGNHASCILRKGNKMSARYHHMIATCHVVVVLETVDHLSSLKDVIEWVAQILEWLK